MITLTDRIAGDEITINIPQTQQDINLFMRWIADNPVVGFDTETTGLKIYSLGFRLRLAQFGNATEAWVLRADHHAWPIKQALYRVERLILHNAPFDAMVLNQTLGWPLEQLMPFMDDTYILAHLLDSRTKQEGGIGHRMKDLATVYVDPDAADGEQALKKRFRELGFKGEEDGFTNIPVEDEIYLRYSGLDPILAYRLHRELRPMVEGTGLTDLYAFECHLQTLLARMQRRGLRVDVPYLVELHDRLSQEIVDQSRLVTRYGVENPNSTRQIATALLAMGEQLREHTPSGQWKVDAAVLLPLADLDRDWHRIEAREPNPLVDAILRTKRAQKWKTAYVDSFLAEKDSDDRIHPSIKGLAARTGRMSISNPPLQQLPSSDATIRRAIIADPGMTMIACDYMQVEMRVLAALSRDEAMMQTILDGIDIHDGVARVMYGEGFTKAQRKIAKNTGFGEVFGGGAATLSRQAGVSMETAKQAKALFAEGFPGIKSFGKRLQREAQYGSHEVVTPSGRHLPLDRDRAYSATNYIVQSTARDILAQAIVDLFDAGLGEHLLIPVHDELVAQAPADQAEEIVREMSKIMNGEFLGIPIESDPEVGIRSWGSLGYGASE